MFARRFCSDWMWFARFCEGDSSVPFASPEALFAELLVVEGCGTANELLLWLEEARRRVREDVCAAPGPDPEGESTLGADGSGLEDDGEARRRFEELGSVAGCDDDGRGRFVDVDVLARTDGAEAEATGEGRAWEPPSFPSMPFA